MRHNWTDLLFLIVFWRQIACGMVLFAMAVAQAVILMGSLG